jgi:2-polyprenyl-6-methoxyphenol hydroxylase-like FAD-dependent oxidoreductase
VDVVVVGGGLAGAATATVLARAGIDVAVIDQHQVYPKAFRAEQLVGEQATLLSRLGLYEAVTVGINAAPYAIASQGGEIIGRVDNQHFGLPYDEMVARVRRQLPASVSVLCGRAVGLETVADCHTVILDDGRFIDARLVIVATGSQASFLRNLGFQRKEIRAGHSLSFGFDLLLSGHRAFSHPLVIYGERPSDKVDYLTIFPMERRIRANLFTYRDCHDPWVQAFRRNPKDMLSQLFPGLDRMAGGYDTAGTVEARVTDLSVIHNPYRPGVVLIGDAFQTSCPATGFGITRLLTDIELLCRKYVSAWLASASISTGSLAAFYNDPRKRSLDAASHHAAEYRRELACNAGPMWVLHRLHLRARRRLGGLIGGPDRLTTGVRPLRGAPDKVQSVSQRALECARQHLRLMHVE